LKSKTGIELSRKDGTRQEITPNGYAHFPPHSSD